MHRRPIGGGCESSFGGGTAGQGIGRVRHLQLRGPRGSRVVRASGFLADTVFTTTGQHLTLISLDISGAFEFSKTYGQKSGLTTFTCTQSEEGVDITSVVGLVPPQ